MTTNNYSNFSIVVISHDINIVDDIIKNLEPLHVDIFNGHGFPSFSSVVNNAIVSAENDNVILINYKARPELKHIYKILDLLEKGYGFVGLYRFGFFGINKNLIKKIGFFDERYIGGEYEDCDFMRRFVEHNIAYYITEEIEYIYRPSLWSNRISKTFFEKKWTHDHEKNIIFKNLNEETYDYNLNIKKIKELLDITHYFHPIPDAPNFVKSKIVYNF